MNEGELAMVFFAEAYLSALLRYGVYDAEGRYVGRLDDVLVDPHVKFPVVTRIAIKPKGEGRVLYVPWSDIRSASQEGMRLAPGYTSAEEPEPKEMHLQREVMDRQIVDVSGKRVVRVHDLKLGAVGNHVLLTHADVGGRGILRRLGWEHFTVGLLRTLHIHVGERLIAWEHVQAPTPGGELHVDHARDALKRMHPADLADIAEELSAPERAKFLGAMDEETAADAMQEMEPEALVATVGELSDEEASELIDEMDPDAGADLLADLPEERAEKLLSMMEPEEAADLRKLLSYAEDTAGGLMTTDQVSVPNGITVREALDLVREEAREIDPLYYVHVVDNSNRLMGVFSLRDLIIADPDAIVDTLMQREVARVHLHTNQEDIARLVARYNLLAVPVVDEDGRLHGIVTADDAIDAVIPTSYKKRIPKAFAR
jgi:CBS domain-containing protein/sporulation protein YlmC with PRC-barrel domain